MVLKIICYKEFLRKSAEKRIVGGEVISSDCKEYIAIQGERVAWVSDRKPCTAGWDWATGLMVQGYSGRSLTGQLGNQVSNHTLTPAPTLPRHSLVRFYCVTES